MRSTTSRRVAADRTSPIRCRRECANIVAAPQGSGARVQGSALIVYEQVGRRRPPRLRATGWGAISERAAFGRRRRPPRQGEAARRTAKLRESPMRGGLPGLSCVALAEPGRLRPALAPRGRERSPPREAPGPRFRHCYTRNPIGWAGTASPPCRFMSDSRRSAASRSAFVAVAPR